MLFEVLKARGYRLVGPRIRDGAIVYDELASVDALPAGWTDEQEGGKYRLREREDGALFRYAVGPHSWKKFLFPPMMRLWSAKRTGNAFELAPEQEETPRYAFIGVRSCELHAIAIQDKVFIDGKFVDPVYAARRKNAFIIAVNCSQAGGTCFCVSMKTGPKAQSGFDLALTEIIEGARHYFLVKSGTDAGAQVLAEIPHRTATEQEKKAAEQVVERTAGQMGRAMDTTDIKELLSVADQFQENAQNALDLFWSTIRKEYPKTDAQLRCGVPAKEIVAVAKDLEVDLIVISHPQLSLVY